MNNPAHFPSSAWQRAANQKTKVKHEVAVVGCGYWGPNLMRNFDSIPRCKLSWLVDTNVERLRLFADRYPQARTTTSLAEALSDAQLHAVAIATPVSSHFALARQCLSAGKHVLLEKPMSQSPVECRKLIQLAKKMRRTLMVDHTFIYTGAVRKIKQLIQSGELGEIYYFDSVRVNLGLFQHDVNVIWDLAPHDLSIMDHVLDKTPTHVAAHGACNVAGSKIENIAYLTLKFPNDTIAHFHVNWLAPAKVRRIIIGGSKKMLVFDDLSPDEKIKIYDKGLALKDSHDSRPWLAKYRIGDLYVPNVDTTEALACEINHFIDCIENRARPQSDGEAGLRVVNILACAQKSLARNGAFVPL